MIRVLLIFVLVFVFSSQAFAHSIQLKRFIPLENRHSEFFSLITLDYRGVPEDQTPIRGEVTFLDDDGFVSLAVLVQVLKTVPLSEVSPHLFSQVSSLDIQRGFSSGLSLEASDPWVKGAQKSDRLILGAIRFLLGRTQDYINNDGNRSSYFLLRRELQALEATLLQRRSQALQSGDIQAIENFVQNYSKKFYYPITRHQGTANVETFGLVQKGDRSPFTVTTDWDHAVSDYWNTAPDSSIPTQVKIAKSPSVKYFNSLEEMKQAVEVKFTIPESPLDSHFTTYQVEDRIKALQLAIQHFNPSHENKILMDGREHQFMWGVISAIRKEFPIFGKLHFQSKVREVGQLSHAYGITPVNPLKGNRWESAERELNSLVRGCIPQEEKTETSLTQIYSIEDESCSNSRAVKRLKKAGVSRISVHRNWIGEGENRFEMIYVGLFLKSEFFQDMHYFKNYWSQDLVIGPWIQSLVVSDHPEGLAKGEALIRVLRKTGEPASASVVNEGTPLDLEIIRWVNGEFHNIEKWTLKVEPQNFKPSLNHSDIELSALVRVIKKEGKRGDHSWLNELTQLFSH